MDLPYGRFAPGTILASRYRIVERVGQGGMGEVYRADDLTLDEPVALKFLPEALSRNPEALKRFRDEVRVARTISHPNLCRVHDIGETDGVSFISMEYIRGEDLRSLLRRIGRIPADKAVEIASQLALALAAAHDKGVLHRDLKPANVMIDERGQARITDFGLAIASGTVESRDIRSGTKGYMAPEQWAGTEVTERSDLYSLGLVLYELFTGRHPFEDPAVKVPARPSSFVSDIEPAVEAVVLQCLERDPAARPASANAVRAALPTRDALAAAIARGETPAPALVADAGDRGRLSPAASWACLVGVVLLLVANVWVKSHSGLAQLVPLPESPEVLSSDAREILATLGYPAPQTDSTFGFVRDSRYIDELMKGERAPDWWHLLAKGEPNVIRFWYRESPSHLVPHRITEFFPEAHDPPIASPGMVNVELDTRGRLRRLEAAPPAVEGEPTASLDVVDWSILFGTAGLSAEDFEPIEPVWVPERYADQRAAWQGVYPEAPEIPIRLEAGAYRGRVVDFRIVDPWTAPADDASGWTRPSDVVPSRVARWAHVGLHLLFLIALALLARHNLRLGRGDKKLAFRLASVLGSLMMLHWLLASHHVAGSSQLDIFFGGLYRSFFVFGLSGLMYLALEPYARKLWPRALVSWVRLFQGRFRDPVIGRDVLVGCLQGVGVGLVSTTLKLLPLWTGGVPARPDLPRHPAELVALRGLRESLAELVLIQVNIATHVLFLFVALLLLRLLFRKTSIAVAVHASLYVFVYGPGHGYVGIAIWIVTWHLVFLRFGWLAIWVGTVINDALGGFPLTTDLSAWHAHPTLLLVAFVLALAVYGFKISLGDRPVFQDLLEPT